MVIYNSLLNILQTFTNKSFCLISFFPPLVDSCGTKCNVYSEECGVPSEFCDYEDGPCYPGCHLTCTEENEQRKGYEFGHCKRGNC